MLCILHGYLLEGSGSNLWTRCVVESLCMEGHTVQLVCQEPYPERYDCIAEAYRYHLDGTVETMVSRDVPYPGKCIMHKPQLGDTLPVYVWDKYDEYPNVVPMVELDDAAIESYLARNVDVVMRVVQRYGVHAMHANHAVLMSVVAQRVSAATGVPYAVMPHGSALEYAVKIDERFKRLATDAFSDAGHIFVHGEEMRNRVATILPDVPNLDSKFSVLPLGVHTAQFEPVPRERRREKMGRLFLELSSLINDNAMRPPAELTMLGKTLLNLDNVGCTLDPDFDPNAAIRRNAAELMRQRVRKSLSPGNLFAGVMELKEFAENLPRRVNTILDRVASNSLEVKVDAIDEKMLLEGFIKVANRITMGLILASLIVGAALLMRVETSFRILGYPGLAIVCFFGAAAGGVTLVFNILWSDHKHRQRTARGGSS